MGKGTRDVRQVKRAKDNTVGTAAPRPACAARSAAALSLRDVSVVRGGRALLRGITFDVPHGATCAVVGPNGSGKSTLLRVIEGFQYPTRGEVRILGETLGETVLADLRKRVKLVGSAGALDFEGTMTLERVAATGAEGNMYEHVDVTPEVARRVRREMSEVGLARRGGVLWAHASAGERTRALLARARTSGADHRREELLLLDEPTANLDPAAREETVAIIGAPPAGVSQLIVTHHVEELPPITSLALVLREGRALAFGPPAKVLTSAVLTRAFDVKITVSRKAGRFHARVG